MAPLHKLVNTFAAQKDAERRQTNQDNWKRDARYQYDPEYQKPKEASAVWQFEEYAAHRVTVPEVLLGCKVERKTLVRPPNGENIAIAGIKYRITETLRLGKSKKPKGANERSGNVRNGMIASAENEAEKYREWYPEEEGIYLSYFGKVKLKSKYEDPPANLSEAQEKVQTVKAIVQGEGR